MGLFVRFLKLSLLTFSVSFFSFSSLAASGIIEEIVAQAQRQTDNIAGGGGSFGNSPINFFNGGSQAASTIASAGRVGNQGRGARPATAAARRAEHMQNLKSNTQQVPLNEVTLLIVPGPAPVAEALFQNRDVIFSGIQNSNAFYRFFGRN